MDLSHWEGSLTGMTSLMESGIKSAGLLVMASYTITVPVASLLTGIISMQWSNYVWNTREEPKLLRALASVVTFTNVIQFGISTALLCIQATAGLDSPLGLFKPQRLAASQNAATLITVTIVQYYFSNVVLKSLYSSRIWTVVSTVLMASTIVGGIGSVWAFVHVAENGPSNPPKLFSGIEAVFYCLWLGSSATFDVLVSTILCLKLFSAKKKSKFGPTSDVLSYLLATTLETFSLTALTALAALLLTVIPYIQSLSGLTILRCTVGSSVCTTLLGPFSAICFLYTLNRRAPLRARFEQSRGASEEAHKNHSNASNLRNKFGTRCASNAVNVNAETTTNADHGHNGATVYGQGPNPVPIETFTITVPDPTAEDYLPLSRYSDLEKTHADVFAVFDQGDRKM